MKPLASLSLDLDNKWSYLKTHGDRSWEGFPSYLDVVVPRILEILDERGLRITFFVVGQDAALEKNDRALAQIVRAGHELANHSFSHEPWLQRYSREQLELEFEQAELAISRHSAQRLTGFRGPGFSCSPEVIRLLIERGYEYDGSTFPTFLGPAARAYYFLKSRFSPAEKEKRKNLFGSWMDGFQRLKPYHWRAVDGQLLEIPVSTIPLFRVPYHLSYVHYLGQFSSSLAKSYFWTALKLSRLGGVEPSVLLHPLDFLGGDDEPELAFFPGMRMPAQYKLDIVRASLKMLGSQFDVLTMSEHARRLSERKLPARETGIKVAVAPGNEAVVREVEQV
jgi:hypothetical protein